MAGKRGAEQGTNDRRAGKPAEKKIKLAIARSQSAESTAFQWESCRNEEDDLNRLEIKEAAVRVAYEQAEKVARSLRELLEIHTEASGEYETNISLTELVKNWLSKFGKSLHLMLHDIYIAADSVFSR
jgi:hypothetical protein